MNLSLKDRLIVALDVSTMNEAFHLCNLLKGQVGMFKIGLKLFTAVGPPAVRFIHKDKEQKIFLDLKFHDIPATMGEAAAEAAKLDVAMFSVHGCASEEAIRMAGSNKGRSHMVGVTVLTSTDTEECKSIFGKSIKTKVVQFATRLKENGAWGIICSPLEAQMLRQHEQFNKLMLICPGIRPEWALHDDQKRFTTPKKALELGADYLVIGRPITQAPLEIGSPSAAVRKILEEMK